MNFMLEPGRCCFYISFIVLFLSVLLGVNNSFSSFNDVLYSTFNCGYRLVASLFHYSTAEPLPTASIHIVVVTCVEHSRVFETLVGFKSALYRTDALIKFHAFADADLFPLFQKGLANLAMNSPKPFQYQLYNITFPADGNKKNWQRLFKPCASQRLFLPHILSSVDSVLYIDTDILFLDSVENLWRLFDDFNSTQLAALAPEHEQKNVGWYSRFARHPYWGETGLNSGVMLMNLTRMRNAKFVTGERSKETNQVELVPWNEVLLPLYNKYRYNITWGDQDLLNIIFHHNPDKLLSFPCFLNYRPDHCMYGEMCKQAKTHGVKVLHGCRRAFHIEKWPTFKAIYDAFDEVGFNDDVNVLVDNIKSAVDALAESNCKLHISNIIRGIES